MGGHEHGASPVLGFVWNLVILRVAVLGGPLGRWQWPSGAASAAGGVCDGMAGVKWISLLACTLLCPRHIITGCPAQACHCKGGGGLCVIGSRRLPGVQVVTSVRPWQIKRLLAVGAWSVCVHCLHGCGMGMCEGQWGHRCF